MLRNLSEIISKILSRILYGIHPWISIAVSYRIIIAISIEFFHEFITGFFLEVYRAYFFFWISQEFLPNLHSELLTRIFPAFFCEFWELFQDFLPEFVPGLCKHFRRGFSRSTKYHSLFHPEVFLLSLQCFSLNSIRPSKIFPMFLQEFLLNVFRDSFLTAKLLDNLGVSQGFSRSRWRYSEKKNSWKNLGKSSRNNS